MIARAMLLQMRQPRDGLLDARPMAGRHPPQRDGRSLKMLEPVGAAPREECCEFSTTGKSPKAVKYSSKKYFALPEF
jgi:hypothetical protein